MDNGTDGVEDELRGEVISPGQLGLANRLFVPLRPHDLCAGLPELKPRGRMDRVVDAAVAGVETAEKGAVCGVDDGPRPQPCDIALPEDEPRLCGGDGKRFGVHNPFFFPLFLQKRVLRFQKIRPKRRGRAEVHQTAQQAAARSPVLRKRICKRPILRHFLQKNSI